MSIRRNNQLENVRKIALEGFIGPNQAMLEYCFSSAVDCELVTASRAAIIIVNGDQANKDADVQQQINEKFQDAYKIVISIRDLNWDGFILLKKPHTSEDLLNLVRRFEVETPGVDATHVSGEEKHAEPQVRPGDVDFYRGGQYSKKRKSEALKQKLIRGNLVVSASDRLVKQLEDEIKTQEAELVAKLEAEKLEQTKLLIAKKKALKLKELKLEKLKQERLKQEKLAQARLEKERIAQENLKKERAEQARLKREQLERERLKSERLEKARLERERIEQVRIEQERINKERLERVRLEQEKKAQQKPSADKAPVHEAETTPTEFEVDSLDVDALEAGSQSYVQHALTAEEVLQRCGNAGDADLSKKEERRRVFFSVEDSLLVKMMESVELARKMEQPVEITGLPGTMYFLPDEDVFYSTFSDDFLNQLALTRFGYQELDLEAHSELELDNKNKHLIEDAKTLIWKVAIWTARGRLFNGMDPERSMQLSTKPDFVRFLPLPSGEEISDVWAEHSLSALDVVRILDVPQRVVFSFMSGAYSLGWFQE